MYKHARSQNLISECFRDIEHEYKRRIADFSLVQRRNEKWSEMCRARSPGADFNCSGLSWRGRDGRVLLAPVEILSEMLSFIIRNFFCPTMYS